MELGLSSCILPDCPQVVFIAWISSLFLHALSNGTGWLSFEVLILQICVVLDSEQHIQEEILCGSWNLKLRLWRSLSSYQSHWTFLCLGWRWVMMGSGTLSPMGIVRTMAMKKCGVLRYFIGPKVTTFKVLFCKHRQNSLFQLHWIGVFQSLSATLTLELCFCWREQKPACIWCAVLHHELWLQVLGVFNCSCQRIHAYIVQP